MRLTNARLQRIPHAPGVYTFTKRGVPIYIGKAADLRARIAAYTPGKDWKADMVAQATGLTIERTDSELEALLLEANRIAVHRPKYNIANRDQKTFLSILVTTGEEFPQVLPTRSHARTGTYFGPFTSAHAVRETLRTLRKIFPYRCNRKPIAPLPPNPPSPHGGEGGKVLRPCLYFHLGQCAGTCAGRITPEEYRRRVIVPLLRVLTGRAKSARVLLDAEHRRLLDSVLAHTRVLSVTEKYAVDLRELQRVLHLPELPRRIEGYDVSNIHGIEAVGSMVVALDGEPAPSEYKRFKVRTLEGQSNDVGMLREVLTRRLRHHPSVIAREQQRPKQSRPRVFMTGIATPRPGSARNDKEEWPDPDLILIDGGRAQLNAALRAMRSAGVSFPAVALAKREEEIYLPGERAPLRLPGNAPALHLLQRVRDEAHRFAVGYHRLRYRKRILRG